MVDRHRESFLVLLHASDRSHECSHCGYSNFDAIGLCPFLSGRRWGLPAGPRLLAPTSSSEQRDIHFLDYKEPRSCWCSRWHVMMRGMLADALIHMARHVTSLPKAVRQAVLVHPVNVPRDVRSTHSAVGSPSRFIQPCNCDAGSKE